MPSQKTSVKAVAGSHMEVFDPAFKYLYLVPSRLVMHIPPARLNITRLVVCRNYIPGKEGSCVKDENCRFVHADVDYETLEAHPIHVNYVWRHEDLCTYERLPPGSVLEVLSRSGNKEVDLIPSERILVTRRALARRDADARPLSHCVHYFCNRMCNRGESCNFIHVVYVDPNVRGDFKRAPVQAIPRFNASALSSRTDISDYTSGPTHHSSPNASCHASLPSFPHASPMPVPVPGVGVGVGEVGTPTMPAFASTSDSTLVPPLDASEGFSASAGFSLSLAAHRSHVSLPGLGSCVQKSLEPPAGLSLTESPGGFTLSPYSCPSLSFKGPGFAIQQTPTPSSSQLDLAPRNRSYRHNPYLPVRWVPETTIV